MDKSITAQGLLLKWEPTPEDEWELTYGVLWLNVVRNL